MSLYFDVHQDNLPAGPNWDLFLTKVGPLFVLMENHHPINVSAALYLLLKTEPMSLAPPLCMMAE